MSYSGVYDVEFLLMRDARKWKWVVYAAKSLSHSFNNDDAAKSQLEMNKTSLMVRSWQWNFHSALISIAFRFSSAESWVTWLLDESASIAVGGSFQLQKCKKCRNARNWPIKRTTMLKILWLCATIISNIVCCICKRRIPKTGRWWGCDDAMGFRPPGGSPQCPTGTHPEHFQPKTCNPRFTRQIKKFQTLVQTQTNSEVKDRMVADRLE